MGVSQKCQYALRALFELAKRKNDGVVRVQEIAEAQYIPQRFLENILNQLRQGGFVESRRGKAGGFILGKSPAAVTVAEVVLFIDGSIYSADSLDSVKDPEIYRELSVFAALWEEARQAVTSVYESKTLQDLLDDAARQDSYTYHI